MSDRLSLETLQSSGAVGPGEVRVRMRYAPVNPSDFNLIHGTYNEALKPIVWNQGQGELKYDPDGSRICKDPPYTLGAEGMGEVIEAGSGFLARRVAGKRVALVAGQAALSGTWQEEIIVPARTAVPLPAGLDDRQGSMLFVNPMTAYVLIREVLKVRPGELVLLSAGGEFIGPDDLLAGR